MNAKETLTGTVKNITAIKKAVGKHNSAFNIKQIIPGLLNDVDPSQLTNNTFQSLKL